MRGDGKWLDRLLQASDMRNLVMNIQASMMRGSIAVETKVPRDL